MKSRLKKKGIILTCLTLTTLMSFSVAVTAAAFSIAERHNQSITIDMGYAKYFGTGTDANGQPVASGITDDKGFTTYYINNSNHLRNLSRLVNTGCFSSTDIFEVTNDIVYSGPALTPIGTDQFPFRSTFRGKDFTSVGSTSKSNQAVIISKLEVIGLDLGDVGMFGYASNESEITNFILDTPTVRSAAFVKSDGKLAKGTFQWDHIDGNPLRDLKNGDKYLFGPDTCETINIKYALNNDKTFNAFTIDASSINLQYVDEDGIKTDFDLEVGISKKDIIQFDGNKKLGSFSVLELQQDKYELNEAGRPKEGEYVTIEYIVKGLVKTANGYRYCEMVLERFKLFYDYAKKAIIGDPQDFKCPDKTIYPATYVESTEDNSVGEEADTTYTYAVHDDVRGLYVGVVAGRVEGLISFIGVYNPSLDINRPFISNSLLIGKAIDDSNKRILSVESFNGSVDLSSTNKDNKLHYMFVEQHLYNYFTGPNQDLLVPNADKNIGNRFVKDIYKKQDDINENNFSDSGMTPEARNIMRIYGNHLADNNDIGPDNNGTNNVTDSIQLDKFNQVNYKGESLSDVKGIGITKPMKTKMTVLYKHRNVIWGEADVGFNALSLENCLQFWISAKHNRSKINANNNGNLEFYLKIEMDYLYFDNVDTSGQPSTHLEIQVAEKALRRRRRRWPGRGNSTFKSKVFYSVPHNVNPGIFTDDTYTANLEKLGTKTQAPSQKTPNFTIPYYPFAYLDENKTVDGIQTPENILKFSSEEIAGTVGSTAPEGGYKVQTKVFNIVPNDKYKHSGDRDRIPFGFFPSFYIGLVEDKPESNYKFSILGMRVIISNKRGNADSTIASVDFIGKNSSTNSLLLPLRNNNWNGTRVKVSASTIKTFRGLESNEDQNGSFPHFAAVHKEALVNNEHCQYLISATKLPGNKVQVTYSPLDTNKKLNYIMCQNLEGFEPAILIRK